MTDFTRRSLLAGAGAAGGFLMLPGGWRQAMAAAAKTPEFLTFHGGGQGGAWHLGAAALAELSKGLWPKVSTTATVGAGKANVRNLGVGKIEFGFAFGFDVTAGYKGVLDFKAKPASKIRAVMSTNGAYVTALGKPDIKTFADLAGKAAAPGRGGMTGRVTYQYVLNELGIKSKVKEINSGYAEMPSLFKDGIAQAVVVIGSIPHPVIDEILSTHQGNLLPIDGKVAKVLTEKYNYEAVTIPAGTFKGQKADVQTVGSVTTLCTHADVPEEWVYKLTKAAWEGRQRLIQAHKAYKELDKTMVTKGVRIPFHPGAARYWREVGILKS